MSLGLNYESTTGDFLPIIKYDARAGKFFRVDREQQPDGSWDSETTDISDQAQFAVDFANIEVGWINFAGGAPNFVLVPIGEGLPPQPSKDHKQGFRVQVYNKKLGLREFSHTAKCVLQVMEGIHNEFEAAPEKASKLPIVKMTGATPIETKGPHGTNRNYAPDLEIAGWIDPPVEFTEKRPEAVESPTPAASIHVDPPAAEPVQEKVLEDELF